MKLAIATLTLTATLALAPAAHAMGSKSPSNPGSTQPEKPNQGDALIDLGLTLAITYAKSDPRYSTILGALGINNAQDLRGYLAGNGNGLNMRNIVARLAFLQAQRDPKVASSLAQLGITDEASLRAFLSNPTSGSSFDMLIDLALQQAKSNPKYSLWLDRLNIDDAQDVKNLLKGGGQGNLQDLVIAMGLAYLEERGGDEYQQYYPLVIAAAQALGLDVGNLDGVGQDEDSSDDDIIDLGPFKGMTVGETKAVRKLK